MSKTEILITCQGTKYLDISELKFLQGNLKELREKEFNKLKKSIQKYGFRFPVFLWNNYIIDGHQRVFVVSKMIENGYSIGKIPIVEIDAENEKEAKRLILLASSRYGGVTDDGLYEFIMTSELDFNELKEEIDLPEIDFKQFEQCYFTDEPQDAEPQIDRAEELNKKWQVKTGDLFTIGGHRLLCGDSTKAEDVERVMGGEKADLLLTDPPYGINIVKVGGGGPTKFGTVGGGKIVPPNYYRQIQNDDKPFDPSFLFELAKKSIIFGANYFSDKLSPSSAWIIWDKETGDNNFADCELAWSNFEKPMKIYRYLWAGLRREGERRLEGIKRFHPTQKPVGLFSMILEDFSKEGESIFDPYAGSGVTILASENKKRCSYLIEIDPPYCAVILERMATAFPGIEIKRI